MRNLIGFSIILSLAAGGAVAQERAAAGSMETQMTWATLSDQIAALKTQVTGTNTRMDQLVICGKKGMLYAPDTAGADAQGCLPAKAETPTLNPYRLTSQFFTERRLPANTLSYCQAKGFDMASSVVPNTSAQMVHHAGGGSSGGGEDVLTTVTNSYTIGCMGSNLR